MNLKKSVDNLAKRLERLDHAIPSHNKTGLNHWKGKPIVPLEDWVQIKDTAIALQCFPDDFHIFQTFIPETDLQHKNKDTKKWYSDYIELMEFTRNESYGRVKCFDCLLDPGGNDPIFIDINRLVSKGLKPESPNYPCQVVNRFQCPYEKTAMDKKQEFDVDNLFRLFKMAFAVEISLAKARKEDSKFRIKDKQDLYNVLTDKETFDEMLEQGEETLQESEYLRRYAGQDKNFTISYFMKIKDKVSPEELRFY